MVSCVNWPKENWVKLINDLERQGYFCLLMGGPDVMTLKK